MPNNKLKNMNKYIVRSLSAADVLAEAVPTLLDRVNIPFEAIGNVNWPADFPYKPTVAFRMAYAGDNILINYQVDEDSVRAVAPEDNGHVWEDSCCEFFVSPSPDAYYNIECNCAGTLLIGYGPGRENRQLLPPNVLQKVDRWSSLGRQPFAERVGKCQWQMALVLPVSTFMHHPDIKLQGCNMRANFYKCGDKTQKPHFLSWNAIHLPKPDFHCPPFFGEIRFEP